MNFSKKCYCAAILFLLEVIPFAVSEVEVFGKSFIDDVTISAKEKDLLDQFISQVSFRLRVPYMRHEFFLVRWLRARNYNLDAAEQMLIDHLNWWDDNHMDTIEQQDWTDFNRDYKVWLIESDKEGRPIYVNLGGWDVRKSFITGHADQLMRYAGMMLEKGTRIIRKLGEENKNVSQGVVLINVQDFNLVTHGCLRCLSLLFRFITLYENHFPGYVNKILVVNTPTAALFIADPARQIFHPDTNKILRVYGAKRHWQPVLEKYIDKNRTPKELGGSKVLDGREYDY